MNHTSPLCLAREQITVMGEHVAGVTEGHPDSIHDARVAARRLREILPLLEGAADTSVASGIRKAGRCLGRIRDLDVESALLQRVEEQLPATAPVTTVARAVIQRRRSKRLKKAIKKLERLDLKDVATRVLVPHSSWRERLGVITGARARLRTRMADRVCLVRQAVAHATGVYFPRRVHATRIAVKKLRYVVEVASVTGAWRPRQLLKDLRKMQSLLGDLHDADTLSRSLDRLVAGTDVDPSAVALVRDLLESEIAALHSQYVAARQTILAACDACERFAEARGQRRVLVAGSLLAVSVAMPAVLLVRGSPRPCEDHDRVVA